MSKSWQVVCCVSAWFALGLFTHFDPVVRADDAVPAPDQAAPTAPSAQPNATLVAAVRAYEAGDMEQARVLFEQVHAEAPTARTLRSLGLVAFRQERFSEAVTLFEAALASEVRPLTGWMRDDVLGLLGEARGKLASQAVVAASAFVVPPAVEQGASPPVVRDTAPPNPELPPESSRQASPRSRRLRRVGYALLGVAGASLATAGVAYLTGRIRLQRITDHCRDEPDGRCTESDAAAREHAARLDTLSRGSMAGAIMAGVSAAGAATVLTFHYLPSTGGDRPRSVLGLTVRTSF